MRVSVPEAPGKMFLTHNLIEGFRTQTLGQWGISIIAGCAVKQVVQCASYLGYCRNRLPRRSSTMSLPRRSTTTRQLRPSRLITPITSFTRSDRNVIDGADDIAALQAIGCGRRPPRHTQYRDTFQFGRQSRPLSNAGDRLPIIAPANIERSGSRVSLAGMVSGATISLMSRSITLPRRSKGKPCHIANANRCQSVVQRIDVGNFIVVYR